MNIQRIFIAYYKYEVKIKTRLCENIITDQPKKRTTVTGGRLGLKTTCRVVEARIRIEMIKSS